MSRRRVVSRHILRRRARAQRKQLEDAQAVVNALGDPGARPQSDMAVLRAQKLLEEHGVEPGDMLSVPHRRVRGKWVVEVQ
jgi:hypothetical protein